MSFYLLDGRICPALPLDELEPETGYPLRLVYFYKGTEGGKLETRVSNDLVRVPDDDGASWTPQNVPHGAIFYVEVADGNTNLQAILNRLEAVKARRDAIVAGNLGGETHGPADPGVGEIFAPPATQLTQDPRPLWQQLGFESKAAWKDAGSPQK